MQDDPNYVRQAFAAGAAGYVLKEAADTDLVAAVREVAGGGRYVHPTLGARMVVAEAEERERAEQDPLSDRERDVLRLLALGHTNQEISDKLFISVRTAETHRAHIMRKLRSRTRAELVRYALEHGLLELDAGQTHRPAGTHEGRPEPPSVGGASCFLRRYAVTGGGGLVCSKPLPVPSRRRSAPPSASTMKPKPLRRSAIPTTMPNRAICSAM